MIMGFTVVVLRTPILLDNGSNGRPCLLSLKLRGCYVGAVVPELRGHFERPQIL